MILVTLFLTFFKIGLFSFGGGYAMLPMIYHEVVEKNIWISPSNFTDIVAISQITPGPIAINSATYIGILSEKGILGAIFSTLGVTLPSLIIMIILCKFINRFKKNPYLEYVFLFLRPIVVGFILSSSLLLMNKENFIDYKSYVIFFISLLLMSKKINPIFLILCSALVGIIFYQNIYSIL